MSTAIRIALIDLYEGIPNEGIRAITEAVDDFRSNVPGGHTVEFVRFDTRTDATMPDLSFDIYISSGGPGSPFDGEGTQWEENYFKWVDEIVSHNAAADERGVRKKHVVFICHSFQLMCRYYDLATVTERHSPSFGILKVHQTDDGRADPLFADLRDPFYAADFRRFQVIQPKTEKFEALGAKIIAIEKDRPHLPYERAIMGIRISDEIVGVQFHPEADPPGMRVHFLKAERRRETVAKHSEEKFLQIMDRLYDPDYLEATHCTILPNFFASALDHILAGTTEPEVTG
ncbi:MAG: GMP synthase [Rhodothermales bacterium]|nr:GMP synthase [Rhodothermales bacterium]